ncbi:MAG: HEAT repeat domain-containing protein, partial [Myxococcales bacterium]|nr:HEAT repeat domain-containing protein [Myxococcales bacterium]
MRFLALSVALGLGCLCAAGPSRADIWPAGHERIARAFASGDDAERRGAAQKLLELPAATARELAVRGLDDPDLDVRLLSAHAAATLRIPGLGDRVVGWLAETDVRLRTAACEVIDASPTPASVTALGRVLSDSKAEVRRAAAAAMGASGMPVVVEPLLGHLDDVEVVVRLEVVRALGRIGDARAVLPLVAKIQDTETEVRRSAVRALGELGDGRAVATLMLALQDTAPAVRLQALDALGRLHAEQAVTAIASLLAEDQRAGGVAPELLREAALVALGRIATPEAVKLLVDELEHESPSDEPGPVARAIALAGPRAVDALRAALDASSSRALAAGAAAALAALGAREALPSLLRAIERGAVPVAAGFRALARLGDAEALPFALARLDDPDPQVRALAVEVAQKLVRPSDADGRAVDPVVPRLLDLETPLAERIALAALLGRTGSPRALDPLVALAKARQPGLRLAALRALGALGQSSPAADTVLIEALADGSEEVRTAAATALSRVARDDAARALLTQLEVAAEQDRGAIGLALSGALGHSTDPGLVATVQAALPRAPAAARDTLIEGLGRMRVEAAEAALAELALAADADDRRKVAEALGGQAAASPTLGKLLADPDPRVRASAAWSLG